MRILQISSAQFLGGGERYLADLANALAYRGHQVYAVLRPNSPLITQLPQLPKEHITTLRLRNSFDANSARHLASFVKDHEIEVVHAHMARDYPLAAYAAARSRNARLIVTRHVLFPLNPFHKLTLSRVARVIAVSGAVELQLRSEKVVPRERIAVIPNGVDMVRFDKARSEFDRSRFLRNWNLPEGALLIGTVGEIKALKGQEEFLQAAAHVAERWPNSYFIVAGIDSSHNQQNRTRLERLVDELGLRKQVRFVDWLEDIAALHYALDVFVSASRAESFGLALAEAMAAGTAVIATKTEGAKELVEIERTGLLVSVGDHSAIAQGLIALLGDKEKRERLGRQAKEEVRARFSLERMVEATESVYREAIQKSDT